MKNRFRYVTHKWVDIGADQTPKSLLEKIKGWETYRDTLEIGEHMYGISYFSERFEEEGIPLSKEEQDFINKIIAVCEKSDAGYIRFIYT